MSFLKKIAPVLSIEERARKYCVSKGLHFIYNQEAYGSTLHAFIAGAKSQISTGKLHRCCKALSGLCTNSSCPHFDYHVRTVDWRGTGESCGQWTSCRFLNSEKENIKVRCI